MTINFLNIALKNIQLILDSPTESARSSELIYDENKDVSLEEQISFLVNNDYIETESNDDIYFLTPYAYSLKDQGSLESYMRFKLRLDDPDYHEEEARYSKEAENHFNGLENSKKVRNIAAVVFFTILAVLFTFNYNSKEPILPELKLDEKTIKEIQQHTDSLIKIHSRDSI